MVDAELGILLHRQEMFQGQIVSLTQLTSVTVNPPEAADDSRFRPPPGSVIGESLGERLREFFDQPGWRAAKTAAGLAAGGLGAWVRYSPFRDGDRVFRTYFVNNRGDEALGRTWSYLDLSALGRQEEWEDSPEGYPQSAPYNWWNWHGEYDHPELAQGRMKGWK